MRKVRAIVIHQHGAPEHAVGVEEIEVLDPNAGEVLVEVLAAPINPADLNVIEGRYPILPALPGVPGGEGVARVVAVGPSTSGVTAGDLVLLPSEFGSWRAAGVVNAARLVRVPDGVPLEVAAMLRINPATALCMLREFVRLEPGDWVVQNAGNSGVGRAVVQIAHQLGLRTITAVRRPELISQIIAEGGDVVLLDDDTFPKAAQDALAGAPVQLGLNAVGGESALRLAGALAPGGTLVTYGAMGKKPLRIPNGLLIFKDLAWRGFWVTRWYQQATAERLTALFSDLFTFAAGGALRMQIERQYPLADAATAIVHAQQTSRAGKILFAPPLDSRT